MSQITKAQASRAIDLAALNASANRTAMVSHAGADALFWNEEYTSAYWLALESLQQSGNKVAYKEAVALI